MSPPPPLNPPPMIKTVPESELPTVKLLGEDGNAFSILGKVRRELTRISHRENRKGNFSRFFDAALGQSRS